MIPKTHNGFVLDYSGPMFPATTSNQITYECFCLMGGLSNDRMQKIKNGNDTTYHKIDTR